MNNDFNNYFGVELKALMWIPSPVIDGVVTIPTTEKIGRNGQSKQTIVLTNDKVKEKWTCYQVKVQITELEPEEETE